MPTRRKAPKALRRRSAVAAGDGTKTAQLARERNEALGQLSAASEVLDVINSSPGDLQAVFAVILASATRICQAEFGTLYRFDGEKLHFAAEVGAPRDLAEFYKQREPHLPPPGSHIERVVRTKRPSQTADYTADAVPGPAARFARAGSTVWVPMLKNDLLVGVILVYRQEIRLFTDRQIALLQNFAAQAVTAIENARLLNELRESLEQQTATAEVLHVISKSPSDLERVFQSILENATRLCEARFGNIFQFVGNAFHFAARVGTPRELAEFQKRRGPFLPVEGGSMDRMMRTKQVVHVVDNAAETVPTPAARLGRARSTVDVPMIKDGALVGAIAVYRQEVRPFTDKQIALVQNFAAQAVIAIENARLLKELRQRTTDLTESLEQQTATSEVLKVISGSPGELKPVFDAVLENATRLCAAKFATLWLCDGDLFHAASVYNAPPAYAENRKRGSIRPSPHTALGRVAKTKQTVQIADITTEQAYIEGDPLFVTAVQLGGYRAILSVPMLKDNELIGAIAIHNQEVRPFTEKQIELVQNFAKQAVIAIENTRLLSELRQRTADVTESLEQQTATAEVLRVISSSPGELKPVFQAMLENAVRICEANFGAMTLYANGQFRAVARHNVSRAIVDARQGEPAIPAGLHSPLTRVAATKQLVHIPDLTEDVAYKQGDPAAVRMVETQGARTFIIVPMLKENELIGTIGIYRQEVRPFTNKQIELVKSFAAQAVIAIENTRLLNELRQSLEQQTATADVLRVISSSPGELEPVFQSMLENATRICEAQFANMALVDGEGMRIAAIHGAQGGFAEFRSRDSKVSPHGPLYRLLETKSMISVADLAAEARYARSPVVTLAGARTFIGVPMFMEEKLVGAIAVYRREVRPFTDKQIELLKNFAAQAVIAIENTRLLNELRQRTTDLSKSLEDLRTAQDRLVQTEKLASLGQLTAGIAHEIKNPLNFVNNFSSVSVELIDELREELAGAHLDNKRRTAINEIADTLQSNLDKVVQHGKRADAIVKNMLLHSRQGSGEHRPVDLNALVEESLNLAYHGARAEKQGFNITLERSFDPAAGEADLFPQEITRVLLNLISNGFYAATKRKAETNGGDYEPTLAAATKNLGDRVEIRIRDNGTGISPEVKAKLFNPFFTTKPAGEGTGLGLSISHDIIVKQHGGSIEVDTKPGEFTEFRIVLPRTGMALTKAGERA